MGSRTEAGLREALGNLLRTPCDCAPDWTERRRHAPDCRHQFIHDYLDDAEIDTLLTALTALAATEEPGLDDRLDRIKDALSMSREYESGLARLVEIERIAYGPPTARRGQEARDGE